MLFYQLELLDGSVLFLCCVVKFWIEALAGGDEVEVLDPAGGTILGGVMCGGVPVFFTRQHGFISVSPTDISPYDFSV